MKKKLLKHLQQDKDFSKFNNILEEVVESLEVKNYILDKKYVDISYVIIDNKIINLDDIYDLCKNFNN